MKIAIEHVDTYPLSKFNFTIHDEKSVQIFKDEHILVDVIGNPDLVVRLDVLKDKRIY